MSEDPIESLLRSAADWEPDVEVRAGLARKALQERRRRSGRSLALAGTAFAGGFAIMACLQGVLPGAPETRPDQIAATTIGSLNGGQEIAQSTLPDGVQIKQAGKNPGAKGSVRTKTLPSPSPTPKARRTPRSLREGRLAPHIRSAKLDRNFVPIDEPTVVPGVIAEPSSDGTEVRLIPAAVSPGDDDVIVTRSDATEGIRH